MVAQCAPIRLNDAVVVACTSVQKVPPPPRITARLVGHVKRDPVGLAESHRFHLI